MGYAHKVTSFVLRGIEMTCAVIILGLLGRFFHLLDVVDAPDNSRLDYAIAMASISVAVSILLMPPLKYSFYCFPLDVALFIMWMVCFALLEDLSGTHTCSSTWFDNYWATYWYQDSGNTTVVINAGSACARWRAVLAFSFIVGFVFLISAVLGFYACATYHDMGSGFVSLVNKCAWWKKPKEHDIEKDAPPTPATEEARRLPDVAPVRNGA